MKEYKSRAQQIQDFKAVASSKTQSVIKSSAVFDTEADDGRDRAESDIVDDEDHIASAQKPLHAARTEFRTPGDRIDTCNQRAETLGGISV